MTLLSQQRPVPIPPHKSVLYSTVLYTEAAQSEREEKVYSINAVANAQSFLRDPLFL